MKEYPAPSIQLLQQKRLIGKRLTLSFANNTTFKLWQSFMPERRAIVNSISTNLFSVEIYPASFSFNEFNPTIEFDKWAAIEVTDTQTVPDGMETLLLPEGLYAVFNYKGLSTDTDIFKYIFGVWLPASDTYQLDNRPHFQVLGDKYKNNDPESEEELWIPVKLKQE